MPAASVRAHLISHAFASRARRRERCFRVAVSLSCPVVADDDASSPSWRAELSDFWVAYARASPRTVIALLEVAEQCEAMRSPSAIARAGNTLRTLLPDIDVASVFERDPEALGVTFASAHKRLLALQQVLCDIDQCADVTSIVERYPKLLLEGDVATHVARAERKLAALAPDCNAKAIVRANPELIYRIHHYDDGDALPISIQNMLLEFERDGEEAARALEYDKMWDERSRVDRGVAEDIDASEWMMDGYFPGDDDA